MNNFTGVFRHKETGVLIPIRDLKRLKITDKFSFEIILPPTVEKYDPSAEIELDEWGGLPLGTKSFTYSVSEIYKGKDFEIGVVAE